MRLYWIKGEPKTQWEFPYKRQGEKKSPEKDTEGRRSYKDRGRTWSYAVKSPKPLGATRSWKR